MPWHGKPVSQERPCPDWRGMMWLAVPPCSSVHPPPSGEVRRELSQPPSGRLLQGHDSSGGSFCLLRAPLCVLSRPPSTPHAAHFFLQAFTFNDAHVGRPIFQCLDSPIHGDTQRGQTRDKFALMAGTPTPFAAPSRIRAGLASCFRHQGKHRRDACTRRTARSIFEFTSVKEPSQAADMR